MIDPRYCDLPYSIRMSPPAIYTFVHIDHLM